MLSLLGSVASQTKCPKIYIPFDKYCEDIINDIFLMVQNNTLSNPYLMDASAGFGFGKELCITKVGYGESPNTGSCIQSLYIPSNPFNKDFGMRFMVWQDTHDMVDNLKINAMGLFLSTTNSQKQFPLFYATSSRDMITVGPSTLRQEITLGGTTILDQQPGEGYGGTLWFTINRIGNVLYAYMNGTLLGQVTLNSTLINGFASATYLIFESL